MRAAALTLLDGYKTANAGSLKQTFQARPASISPPSGFVDSVGEDITYTPAGMQRAVEARIRIVRGTYSASDVAEANDDLVDGFIEYVIDNKHAAGANTLVFVSSVEDEDGWVPEWIAPASGSEPHAYFSTLVTISGEGLFGGLT